MRGWEGQKCVHAVSQVLQVGEGSSNDDSSERMANESDTSGCKNKWTGLESTVLARSCHTTLWQNFAPRWPGSYQAPRCPVRCCPHSRSRKGRGLPGRRCLECFWRASYRMSSLGTRERKQTHGSRFWGPINRRMDANVLFAWFRIRRVKVSFLFLRWRGLVRVLVVFFLFIVEDVNLVKDNRVDVRLREHLEVLYLFRHFRLVMYNFHSHSKIPSSGNKPFSWDSLPYFYDSPRFWPRGRHSNRWSLSCP